MRITEIKSLTKLSCQSELVEDGVVGYFHCRFILLLNQFRQAQPDSILVKDLTFPHH